MTTKIKGIRKTFFNCCGKNVRAINNLYLGLEPNEKFGLLGFNGSWKTTTFKYIINEILIDRGSINLFGFDNQKQFKIFCQRTGKMIRYDKLDIETQRNILRLVKENKRKLKVMKEDNKNYLNNYEDVKKKTKRR